MIVGAGILFGLGAALFQSLSYLASRRFVAVHRGGTLHLLAQGHVLMGVFSLCILPFVIPRPLPPVRDYAGPAVGSVIFYLCGQASLLVALKTSHPSRVSPLLGLKILILALIGPLFLNEHPSPGQWTGVGMSIIGAVLLSRSGEKLAWKGLVWILVTCFFYSVSDINIKALVSRFDSLGLIHASLLGVTLCYLLSGAIGLATLPFLSHRASAEWWKGALPFAVTWFAGIVLLFACFGAIGVVFGNVIQSSRGVISIVVGAYVASAGHGHLERKVGRQVLMTRVAAALLMVGAIALYSLG